MANKRYTSTRTVYKAVKKYDHREFDEFCTQVYKNGYEDGVNSVVGIEIEKAMEVIAGVKGVGPALRAKIKDALYAEFSKYDTEVKTDESAD